MKKIIFMCFVIFGLLSCVVFSKTTNKEQKTYYNPYIDRFEEDFKKLDAEQLDLMMEIYKRAKPYDLAYSAIAIAWQESNLGKWQVNLSDPSCGPYHQSVTIFMKKHKIKDGDFTRNRVCGELISDINFSTATLISEIEAWKVTHKKRLNIWDYVYRSYNAGFNYDSIKAKEYSLKIRARIKVIKRHLKPQV